MGNVHLIHMNNIMYILSTLNMYNGVDYAVNVHIIQCAVDRVKKSRRKSNYINPLFIRTV